MTQDLPFDLSGFRDTFYQEGEDNRETENMLFELFIETVERVVVTMKATSGLESEWSHAAHELKGAAANLKAAVLTDLCKQAEHTPQADSDQRAALLKSIDEESQRLLTAIRSVMAS